MRRLRPAGFLFCRKTNFTSWLARNPPFLRGGYPVFPFAGIIWMPCDKWRLMAVPPEPRLIYSPTKNLDVWLGGEIAGGSFRTDRDNDIRPTKLNGAQVDYEDYRAGVGLKYSSPKMRSALILAVAIRSSADSNSIARAKIFALIPRRI